MFSFKKMYVLEACIQQQSSREEQQPISSSKIRSSKSYTRSVLLTYGIYCSGCTYFSLFLYT